MLESESRKCLVNVGGLGTKVHGPWEGGEEEGRDMRGLKARSPSLFRLNGLNQNKIIKVNITVTLLTLFADLGSTKLALTKKKTKNQAPRPTNRHKSSTVGLFPKITTLSYSLS